MANMRDIKQRIMSVKNIQQITRAMMLVSIAKLKRAETAVINSRPYTISMKEIVLSLATRVEKGIHPFLLESKNPERTGVILITSQRGLCGGFNNNVIKSAFEFLNTTKNGYLIPIGRKGHSHFKQFEWQMLSEYSMPDPVNHQFSNRIAEDVIRLYLNGKLDEVYIVYNEFKSVFAQRVVNEKLLPIIIPDTVARGNISPSDYIYEPSMDDLLDTLLKSYISNQIYQMLLESQSAEHGARMIAMQTAMDNAKKIITELNLLYNRTRQAGITNEIIEITSTVEALK